MGFFTYFYDSSLLVYRNATNFCTLQPYGIHLLVLRDFGGVFGQLDLLSRNPFLVQVQVSQKDCAAVRDAAAITL